MKKLLFIILLFCAPLGTYGNKLPDIVATVNDQPITAYELNERKKMIVIYPTDRSTFEEGLCINIEHFKPKNKYLINKHSLRTVSALSN